MKLISSLNKIVISLVLLLSLSGPAAIGSETEKSDETSLRHDPAVLYLQNREIATFRAERLGYRPAERVLGVNYIIEQYIDQKLWKEATKQVLPEGIQFQVHGRPAFMLTEADLLSGENLDKVSDMVLQNLVIAFAEVREARNKTMLIEDISYAVAATLLMLLLIWGISRLNRKLSPHLEKIEKSKIGEVKVGDYEVVRTGQIIQVGQTLLKLLFLILKLSIFYNWLTFVLKQFPYTRTWGEKLGGYFLDTVKMVFHEILNTLPDVVVIIVIIVLVRLINRGLNIFFQAVEDGNVTIGILDAETAPITRRLVLAIVWLFAFIMAYPYIPGSGSEAFKGVSVMFGFLISFGSAGVVNQFASGLILIYSKALRKGEYVKIRETEGTVKHVGVLSTKLLTPLNEEINIPNSLMVSSISKNYSRHSGAGEIKLQTTVTIGYDTPWRQVEAMLIQAAEKTPGLLQNQPPIVLKAKLTDFYIVYQLIALIEDPEIRNKVKSNLNENIVDIFNEHDVQITSPNYVADPPEKQTIPKEKWYMPPFIKPGSSK